MFLILKKRVIVAIICLLVIMSSVIVYFTAIEPSFTPKVSHIIVLDAGHGGNDGGCVGTNTGVKESDLNLVIVKKLVPYFEDFGIRVILTRQDYGGLYDIGADNEKLSDMEKRREIIQNSNANLVLSIHMNSFPDKRQHGIQAFYQENIEDSKVLADAIQEHLKSHIDGARSFANQGDYYILKCSNTPTALIECGYLSNPEDEANLVDPDYQEKLAYHIFCGVLKYLQLVS